MLKVEINYNTVDTWLEPYIGMEFPVIKEFKKTCVVDLYDFKNTSVKPVKIENEFLNKIFDENNIN